MNAETPRRQCGEEADSESDFPAFSVSASRRSFPSIAHRIGLFRETVDFIGTHFAPQVD
jgi:hypothetical protein